MLNMNWDSSSTDPRSWKAATGPNSSLKANTNICLLKYLVEDGFC